MRYRLIERLGEGGMAEVWRGFDEVLDRQIAIKLVRCEGEGPHAEAPAEARISHPNIVHVHDYGEWTDGRPFVVMELLEGRTLSSVLNGGFSLPWRKAVAACAEIASALAAAHAQGIVHRDVSTSNVMLTPTGARLLDFGIAAFAGEVEPARESGDLQGTPAFMAPERLRGGAVTPASDVYALGVLFYRALSGRLPWPVHTQSELLDAHLRLEPAPLPRIPGLPDKVAELCLRCLAKAPGDRPAAAQIAVTLGRIARVPTFVAPFGPGRPHPTIASAGHKTTALAGRDDMTAADDMTAHDATAALVDRDAPAAGDDPTLFATRPDTAAFAGRGDAARHDTAALAARPDTAAFAGRDDPAAADDPTLFATRPGATAHAGRHTTILAPVRAFVPAPTVAMKAPQPRRFAVILGGLLASTLGIFAWGIPGAPRPAAWNPASPDPAACRVTYQQQTGTANSFSAVVQVQNDGPEAVSPWQVEFAWPGDQTLLAALGVDARQQGRDVVLRGDRLDPGGVAEVNLSGKYGQTNALPSQFSLAGSACQTVLLGSPPVQPVIQTVTPSAAPADHDHRGKHKKVGK